MECSSVSEYEWTEVYRWGQAYKWVAACRWAEEYKSV